MMWSKVTKLSHSIENSREVHSGIGDNNSVKAYSKTSDSCKYCDYDEKCIFCSKRSTLSKVIISRNFVLNASHFQR